MAFSRWEVKFGAYKYLEVSSRYKQWRHVGITCTPWSGNLLSAYRATNWLKNRLRLERCAKAKSGYGRKPSQGRTHDTKPLDTALLLDEIAHLLRFRALELDKQTTPAN